MMNVHIYFADIYLTASLDQAIQIVRQRTILVATKQEGSNKRVLKYLRWPVKLAQPLLNAPIEDVEMGEPIAIIPLVDIAHLSFFRFGKCVERIAIDAVEHLGSNYDIAKFFDLDGEWPVRRIKDLRWTDFWVRAWGTGCTPK